MFSMPVSFRNGHWSVHSDVTVTDELRLKLDACADELKKVSTRIKKKKRKNCVILLNANVMFCPYTNIF